MKKNEESEIQTENTNVENSRIESCEEAVKDGWIYCEICEYKCKKKNTMGKHMRKEHSQCIACDECGKLFGSKFSLALHKGKDHEEIEKERDQSFVFSESMLDEFL